jgi:hypothetical protein
MNNEEPNGLFLKTDSGTTFFGKKAAKRFFEILKEEAEKFVPRSLDVEVTKEEIKKTPYDVCYRQDLFKGKPLIGMKEVKGVVTEAPDRQWKFNLTKERRVGYSERNTLNSVKKTI